jgi:hypothetical protein
LLVLGGAGLLAAAGCGGGGDRLTRDELIDQGDAICAQNEKDSSVISVPKRTEEVPEYLEQLRPVIEKTLNDLKALEPPESLQSEYDAWISETQGALLALDELSEAAAAGDEARVAGIMEENEERADEATRLAEAIGFRDCGVEGRRE